MSYKYQEFNTGTKAVSARLRVDLLNYVKLNGLNLNSVLNEGLELLVMATQRNIPITFYTSIEGRQIKIERK